MALLCQAWQRPWELAGDQDTALGPIKYRCALAISSPRPVVSPQQLLARSQERGSRARLEATALSNVHCHAKIEWATLQGREVPTSGRSGVLW